MRVYENLSPCMTPRGRKHRTRLEALPCPVYEPLRRTNGDAMRDPEMCFEMQLEDGRLKQIHPYYWLC